MSDVLRHFVHANVALSSRIQPSIVTKTHAYTKYDEVGTALLQHDPQTVLDVEVVVSRAVSDGRVPSQATDLSEAGEPDLYAVTVCISVELR